MPAPTDVKPGSITCEECPYPFPSSYLPLTLYGQDVRMAYMDVAPQGTPNGHTVMIFHGNNFAGFYFGNIIDALRKEGFRVIVADQIGYGRSSKPIIPYSLNDMARNSRAILQSLKIDKAMVVGHSMGGMLAARFASHYPAVDERLVIYNPIGLVDTRHGRPPATSTSSTRTRSAPPTRACKAGLMRYVAHNPAAWTPEFENYARIRYAWTLGADWPRLAMVQTLTGALISGDPVVYDWAAHQGADAGLRRRRRRAAGIGEAVPGADEGARRHDSERQRQAALDSRPRPRAAPGRCGEDVPADGGVPERGLK